MANNDHGTSSDKVMLFPSTLSSISVEHSFTLSDVNITIDLVCPQAIFQTRLTLFPSGMLHVTNIRSKYHITTFCSELSGKHASKGYLSLPLTILKYELAKLKKNADLAKI